MKIWQIKINDWVKSWLVNKHFRPVMSLAYETRHNFLSARVCVKTSCNTKAIVIMIEREIQSRLVLDQADLNMLEY